MTFEIDEDIILPAIVGVGAILLTIFTQLFVPASQIDELLDENAVLFSEVSAANREIDTLTKENNKYKVTEESLRRLGASNTEIQQAMMASGVYGIDPKPLEP